MTVGARQPVAAEDLRAQGLRPIELWVPGVSTAAFAAEARRQARAAARSDHAQDDQDFIDAVTDDGR